MSNQETPRLYLELHRACLGGVEGIEEVMGVHAGICKAEGKAGEQGASFHKGQRQHWKTGRGGTREKAGRMDRDPFVQPLEFRLEAKVLAKG